MVVFGESCFIRAKAVCSGKVLVVGQKWFYSNKVIVF